MTDSYDCLRKSTETIRRSTTEVGNRRVKKE